MSTADDLTALKAKALKAYATKDYSLSVDLYSQACELQSKLHGSEDDPRNANLLYLYGRALYKLAQTKSDILGGGAAADDKPAATSSKASDDKPAKPAVLHFEGDENWDDVSDEEDADGEGDAEDDDDDELSQAWTILDLARVLFEKQLPEAKPDTEEHKNLVTVLGDVYDLLGEVSLESESFAQAAKDFQESLKHKLTLHPTTHAYIAEAHFKLALALEFSAAGEEVQEEEGKTLRQQAAEQLEKAIESCRGRLKIEEAKLQEDADPKGKGKEDPAKAKEVAEVKDMIAELEQRLQDLRMPVEKKEEAEKEAVGGLLGELLGRNPEEAKKKLEELVGGANDLTGLVRKKRKAEEPPAEVKEQDKKLKAELKEGEEEAKKEKEEKAEEKKEETNEDSKKEPVEAGKAE